MTVSDRIDNLSDNTESKRLILGVHNDHIAESLYCAALNLSFQLPLQSALSGHYDLTVSSNSTAAAVNTLQHDFQDMVRFEN